MEGACLDGVRSDRQGMMLPRLGNWNPPNFAPEIMSQSRADAFLPLLPMVHQLPQGARDLLPLDVAQKRWIEQRLHAVFHAWGYHRIITPTIERLDSLTAGGAVRADAVIQLQGLGSETLGLRPELTASIARAYASRLGEDSTPQRLYYNANVFRQIPPSGYPSQHEYYQAGVELLGGSGLLADGEVLLLLLDCLKAIDLQAWQIAMGDASLTQALLETFPAPLRPKVRHCLAHLDRTQLEALPLSAVDRDRALRLLDLRGGPQEVLSELLSWPESRAIAAEIQALKSLVELWEAVAPPHRLVLDLSLIRTFDYYTGIVFEVASGNRAIAQGGRYDGLLGVYHPDGKSYPSIGFCLNLEDLQTVLRHTLPRRVAGAQILVVPASERAIAAAFAHAADLRRDPSMHPVTLALTMGPADAVRAEARAQSARSIVWVDETGAVQIETLASS